MHEKSIIQKSISWGLLAMIALYSLASIGNVSEFIHHYHAGWTGYALGAGFGLTLFVSAYIASIAKESDTRTYALFVAGIFGATSAGFQMSLYMDGGATWYIAFPLAFVPICVGEIGIALLESSYSREHELARDTLESARLAVELEQVHQRLAEATQRAQDSDKLRADVLSLQTDLARLKDVEKLLGERSAEFRQLSAGHESLSVEFQNLSAERDNLSAELSKYSADRLIDAMPSKLKDGLTEVLSVVGSDTIASASDFHKLSGMSKTAAYDVFKVAQAVGLVRFENSTTNAFVINK